MENRTKTKEQQDFTSLTIDEKLQKTSEALSESESKFKSIFDNVIDGILLADMDDKKIHDSNKAICRMLGYTREEIRNLSVEDIHPVKEMPYVAEQFEKQSKGEITLAKDIPVKRKDGSVFYADVNAAPVEISGKTYLLGIFRDITERKKTEKEIKGLAKFPEENLNPVYRVSKDGVLLYANPASRRLILEDQTKIGDKIPEKWIGMIKNTYDSGERLQTEIKFNGRVFLFDLVPVIEGGYLNSYALDITERKKAEEKLHQSERQVSAAIEAARGFIFNYDIATGKIIWNGAIEEITGYTSEEFARVDIDGWAEMIHPDDRDGVLSILEEAVQKLDRATVEYRFRTKDGGYVTLSSISLTEKEDGKAVRLMGILQDITERKKAEETLQGQKLALEQKNSALREIVAQIEVEKNKIKDDITANVDEVILPIVKKLGIKGVSRKYGELLQHHLEALTSSFGRDITRRTRKLSPKEIEICSLIKGGLASKEIAQLINISSQTVEKHRKNIRKKLSISDKKINLTSFLQNI